jgi:hypothetical protein
MLEGGEKLVVYAVAICGSIGVNAAIVGLSGQRDE